MVPTECRRGATQVLRGYKSARFTKDSPILSDYQRRLKVDPPKRGVAEVKLTLLAQSDQGEREGITGGSSKPDPRTRKRGSSRGGLIRRRTLPHFGWGAGQHPHSLYLLKT